MMEYGTATRRGPPRPSPPPPEEAQLKQGLLTALQAIQASGSFAGFAPLSGPPPMGLSVTGLGDIETPLREEQARRLIALSRQAPYGKGSETIVDTSVRNTWELDADQFTFLHPFWPAYLEQVCLHVAELLGLETTIRAEIYKMLIYEKGAMFKPHTDTEKIPGMFGTLVITLPSPHEGGEVVLKHCNQVKTFRSSDFDQSVSCWYSDVEHEVTEVTAGYRWVLTYNLALEQPRPLPSAASLHSMGQTVHTSLKQWLERDGENRGSNSLCHFLDHDYTEANVSFPCLKTRDRAQVQALQSAASELPVEIFLALLEKEEMGSCEFDHHKASKRRRYYDSDDDSDDGDDGLSYHELQDVFDRSLRVKTLVDLRGHIVAESLALDKESMLNEDDLTAFEPEEDYEGYMGNSGPTATHWYRRAAVVIVPRDSLVSFFQPSDAIGAFRIRDHHHRTPITYYTMVSMQPQAPPHYCVALTELCRDIWQRRDVPGHSQSLAKSPLSQQEWVMILDMALRLGMLEFFDEAIKNHTGILDGIFFLSARTWLAFDKPGSEDRFSKIQDGLTKIIGRYPDFSGKLSAAQSLTGAPDVGQVSPIRSDLPDSVSEWIRDLLRTCLKTRFEPQFSSCNNGAELLDAVTFFDDQNQFLSESVIPAIRENRNSPAFLLGVTVGCHKKHKLEAAKTPDNKFLECARTAAGLFISDTNLAELMTPQDALRAGVHQIRTDPGLVRIHVASKDLIDLLPALFDISTEAEDLAASFASKLAIGLTGIPTQPLFGLWIPFLRHAVPILLSNGILLDNPTYQSVYTNLFDNLVNRFVGLRPDKNTATLYRAPVNCHCSDCTWLNNFLANREEKQRGFSVGKQRRMHLHQQLDRAGVDCTHETIRVGSPQTLMVRKTTNQQASKYEAWFKRRSLALQILRSFDESQLKMLLGSRYQELSSMDHLLGSTATSENAGSASRTGQQGYVGQEVIDLTSD